MKASIRAWRHGGEVRKEVKNKCDQREELLLSRRGEGTKVDMTRMKKPSWSCPSSSRPYPNFSDRPCPIHRQDLGTHNHMPMDAAHKHKTHIPTQSFS